MSDRRWFRLGDGMLGLDCDDEPLNERFAKIYGDCAVLEPGDLPQVVCRVGSEASVVKIEFEDSEPLDIPRFVDAMFPGRGYDLAGPSDGGATQLVVAGDPTPLDVSPDGRTLRARRDSNWRPLVANLAVSRILRVQRNVLFFHAASFAVAGRGVMACGPKRSGKTTLAMALACRGHALFGDELAAVRVSTHELLPVRRSLAVREGPASALARAALERSEPETEVFPDGELRSRVAVGKFVQSPPPAAAHLTTVLLLRKIASRPVVEAAVASPGLLAHLTPLAASLWGRPPGTILIQLMRLLSASRVYWLDAGPPDQTAELVESLLETT